MTIGQSSSNLRQEAIYLFKSELKYHYLLNEPYGDIKEQVNKDSLALDPDLHYYSVLPEIPVLCEGDSKYINTNYC